MQCRHLQRTSAMQSQGHLHRQGDNPVFICVCYTPLQLTVVVCQYLCLMRACCLQTLERAPVAPLGGSHVLFEQFWLEKGPTPIPDQPSADGKLPVARSVAVVACAVKERWLLSEQT